jgi:hypothetical protein
VENSTHYTLHGVLWESLIRLFAHLTWPRLALLTLPSSPYFGPYIFISCCWADCYDWLLTTRTTSYFSIVLVSNIFTTHTCRHNVIDSFLGLSNVTHSNKYKKNDQTKTRCSLEVGYSPSPLFSSHIFPDSGSLWVAGGSMVERPSFITRHTPSGATKAAGPILVFMTGYSIKVHCELLLLLAHTHT